MAFGTLDRGKLGEDQGSGRICWDNRRNRKRALLLIHVCLGGPAHFLAEIGHRFAECHVAIPIGIGLTAQCPQQIVGEQAMPMLVVLQTLPDAADPDDMESRTSRGIPLGEDGLGRLSDPIRDTMPSNRNTVCFACKRDSAASKSLERVCP